MCVEAADQEARKMYAATPAGHYLDLRAGVAALLPNPSEQCGRLEAS